MLLSRYTGSHLGAQIPSLLRVPLYANVSQAFRPQGQPKMGATAHASDGLGGDLPQTQDEPGSRRGEFTEVTEFRLPVF